MKNRLTEPSGILVVDKPAGLTSHDVVDMVRRAARLAKVGHTGTLDPFATGVLPLCINRGTRLASLLTDGDKVYTGTFRLGITTTTQDPTGEIVLERPVPGELTLEKLQGLANQFVGLTQQTPPMYSAIKVNGERLYELARRGVEIERNQRLVTIHHFDLTHFDGVNVAFSVGCSKGTYIRTLAADLGELVGCGAHLISLRRAQAGPFSLTQAHTPDTIAKTLSEGHLADLLLPLDAGMPDAPRLDVQPSAIRGIVNGGPLLSQQVLTASKALHEGEKVLIFGKGELLAVGEATVKGLLAGFPPGTRVAKSWSVMVDVVALTTPHADRGAKETRER